MSNSAPQEAPLIDNKQLILSCRAACFQPGTCSYQWLKNGWSLDITGLEMAVTETGSYACTDRNNDVVMPFSVTSSDAAQEPNGEQFFKYEDVTTMTKTTTTTNAPTATTTTTTTAPTVMTTTTTTAPTTTTTTPAVEEATSATIKPYESTNKVSAPITQGTGRIANDRKPIPNIKDTAPIVQDPNSNIEKMERLQGSSSGSASSNKPGISSGMLTHICCLNFIDYIMIFY